MIEWIKSWGRVDWIMAVALALVVLLALNFVFGADTLREWVAALWHGR